LNRIPVVLNPVAGGGRLMKSRRRLEAAAHARGVRLEWQPTRQPGHGRELAQRAAVDGHPLVLAFGGDGTYNEVACGVAGTSTAMGVLPGGTTSVLAYEFGVPRSAPRALVALLDGSDRTMRVGTTDRGNLFLLMLSAGPDSVVVRNLPERLKRRGGRVAVAAQAVRELVGGRPLPRMMVTANGERVQGGWAIVGKSRCYGGRHHATPGADPFAAYFETVVQLRTGRLAAVPFALAIPWARHVRRRDVVRLHTGRVLLEPQPETAEIPYQLDGDPVGVLPVEASIAERTVTVRLPHGSPWLVGSS
jgi:diacylglycerol kinase family enzyme